jgi:tetratricopeptide (TPR) repeat protein
MAARAPGQALLALEPLVRMNPTVPAYAYLLGVAWMQLGDPASAQPVLERARELEPRRVLTLAALGIAHNQQKQFAEAKKVLGEAIALAPDDAEVLGVLAEAEEGLGDRGAAEAHAKSALERAPGQATALLVLGLVRMQEQRYAEARQAFEGSLARSPDAAKTHYQLSLACSRLGDRQCATREVERYQKAQRDVAASLATLRTQSLENLPSVEPRP